MSAPEEYLDNDSREYTVGSVVPAPGIDDMPEAGDDGAKRTFDTGATRDTAQDKLDYEGFLSPLALEAYAKYLNKNRTMADGTLRDSDNWQKGIPLSVYMKSLWRHLITLWKCHRGGGMERGEEALCGILFNAFGYLHELKKPQVSPSEIFAAIMKEDERTDL